MLRAKGLLYSQFSIAVGIRLQLLPSFTKKVWHLLVRGLWAGILQVSWSPFPRRGVYAAPAAVESQAHFVSIWQSAEVTEKQRI